MAWKVGEGPMTVEGRRMAALSNTPTVPQHLVPLNRVQLEGANESGEELQAAEVDAIEVKDIIRLVWGPLKGHGCWHPGAVPQCGISQTPDYKDLFMAECECAHPDLT